MDNGAVTDVITLVISAAALGISSFIAVRQLRSTKTSNDMIVAVEMLSREITTDAFQDSEDYIFERLTREHSPELGVRGLPSEARRHILRVGWYYSNLGGLAVFGAVNERIILSMVNYRVRRSWYILEPYIRAERRITGAPFFGFFEHLAFRAAAKPASGLHKGLKLQKFPEDSGERLFVGEGDDPRLVAGDRLVPED